MASSDTSSESKKRKEIFEQGKEWMKRASKRLESKKIEPQSISNKVPPITLPLPASVGNPRMFSIPSVPHVITEFPRILPPLRNNAKSSPLNIQKEHEFSSTPPAIITNQKNNLQLNDGNSSNGEPLMDFNLIEDLPVPSQPLSSEEGPYQVLHLDPSYHIPSLSADHTLCYCSSCAPHPSLYYSNISPLPPKDSPLLCLSTEFIAIILKFAGWKSTLNFSQTCQYFRVLSRSDLIWKHFCNIYHKSRTKPSTDNANTVSLHHGTKYYNLFVKFSTSLPKHAHTTSFQNITSVFGNDEVGFKFKFQFNNIKSHDNFSNDEQTGFAIKYVPKKWVPKRLRCPMWIISPFSISSEILDDVMETFDHSWEEFISSRERLSESDSNSDSDGSTSEEHSGPRSSNLNASMDRVLWPLEPEFEWISEAKGTRDLIIFRFLEDIFAVQCLCVYELKKQKAEAIIRTLQM